MEEDKDPRDCPACLTCWVCLLSCLLSSGPCFLSKANALDQTDSSSRFSGVVCFPCYPPHHHIPAQFLQWLQCSTPLWVCPGLTCHKAFLGLLSPVGSWRERLNSCEDVISPPEIPLVRVFPLISFDPLLPWPPVTLPISSFCNPQVVQNPVLMLPLHCPLGNWNRLSLCLPPIFPCLDWWLSTMGLSSWFLLRAFLYLSWSQISKLCRPGNFMVSEKLW